MNPAPEPLSAIVFLVATGIAIFGSGGHAVAGAILAVGIDVVWMWDKKHKDAK